MIQGATAPAPIGLVLHAAPARRRPHVQTHLKCVSASGLPEGLPEWPACL